MRRARCLMVQGTASGVGKSLLTAALCRLFARAGYRVAPFKAQNMALNAAVTAAGDEIGRAQATQAEAAGVDPAVDMNPILLKPEADDRCQVVVRGAAIGTMRLGEYRKRSAEMFGIVTESLERLRAAYDVIVIEGAGSPVEINFRDADIVNMAVARHAGAPVLLVGDIERGGVFAALVGTVALLAPDDRARVAGFVVNKLHGPRAPLEPGLAELRARTGIPVLGVLPWIDGPLLPAEDALDLDGVRGVPGDVRVDIAVLRLPHIANFDDFAPLAGEPGVHVRFVRRATELPGADVAVVPGSKSTIADLAWLGREGFADALTRAAHDGRALLGVCGGYQMLGSVIRDPEGVESRHAEAAGLGLLPVETTFIRAKTTRQVRARVLAPSGPFAGALGEDLVAYEIHAGRTVVNGAAPLFRVTARGGTDVDDHDGAMSDAGNVAGTYLHGVFANPSVRAAFLRWLAMRKGVTADGRWGAANAGDRYDRLAGIVRASLDVPAIAGLLGLRHESP